MRVEELNHISPRLLEGKLQLWAQLPVDGHAGAAGEGVPPLVHELRLGLHQVLDEGGLDQSEISTISVHQSQVTWSSRLRAV